MSDQKKSLKQIMDFRIEKLDTLNKNGINPYPEKFDVTHNSSEIKEDYPKYEGRNVIVAGRIMAMRKMGRASFMQIMDSSAKIQIFIRKDDIGELNYSNFKLLEKSKSFILFIGIK